MALPGQCGPCGGGSVNVICGPFNNQPAVPDNGICHPKSTLIDCGAPALPVIQCNDASYQTVAQPGNTAHPFAILATLFDQLCLAITDQNGQIILTTIT